MTTDPIADMLTRLRNAVARRQLTVQVPASRLKEAIARMLVGNGWIHKYELIKLPETLPYLLLTLKYQGQQPVIRGVRRISKPGQRIYMNKAQLIKSLPTKLETVIVSTSHGLMTSTTAKSQHLGGEILFKIW
ncbi:MAG: 30S ribosomal protein S8 [Patescibacteria group bacterium]